MKYTAIEVKEIIEKYNTNFMFTTLEIYDIDDFRADFNNICEDCKLFIYFIENTPSEMCNTYDISISFF